MTFNGKEYIINWNAYAKIFSSVGRNDVTSNTTVSQTYGLEPGDDEISMLSKEIVETKYNGNDTVQGLKYDSIKMILECALRPLSEDRKTWDEMPFGQILAINTLVDMGIIKIHEPNDAK